LFNYQVPSLSYSYIPADIYGLAQAINGIQNYYNIILAEFEIKETQNININNLTLTLE
jgi:hypothetical protein